MSDEDWASEYHPDPACDRALAICDLAINFDSVTDRKVREQMLRAMGLLNEGIEANIRPSNKKEGKTLVLFQRPEPDAS